MADEGFDGGTQGIFGTKTLASVKAYQLPKGISSPAGNFYSVMKPDS